VLALSCTIDSAPWDLPAAHIIKISDNKLHEIEAPGFFAPYRSPTDWAWLVSGFR